MILFHRGNAFQKMTVYLINCWNSIRLFFLIADFSHNRVDEFEWNILMVFTNSLIYRLKYTCLLSNRVKLILTMSGLSNRVKIWVGIIDLIWIVWLLRLLIWTNYDSLNSFKYLLCKVYSHTPVTSPVRSVMSGSVTLFCFFYYYYLGLVWTDPAALRIQPAHSNYYLISYLWLTTDVIFVYYLKVRLGNVIVLMVQYAIII